MKGSASILPSAGDALALRLEGAWSLAAPTPDPAEVEQAIAAGRAAGGLQIDGSGVTDWDTALLVYLVRITSAARQAAVPLQRSDLPPGVESLLDLAAAVPERGGARRQEPGLPLLDAVGTGVLRQTRNAGELLDFLGGALQSFGRLLRGRARFRRSDLLWVFQKCTLGALPIVTLINFLVGVILAFVGAMQLAQFGAQIYVADLIAVGVTREMGALMTGIIMAGRTGAAFAAHIGTMTVNEEVDALSTMGIDPMDYLVLPRMLALAVAMPLLCL